MTSRQVVGAGTKTSVSERQEVECWLQGLTGRGGGGGEPCSLGTGCHSGKMKSSGDGRGKGCTEILMYFTQLNSVQFSLSVVSDSLRPHGLQHARPPCPSPTPGAYSNSCPLSRWCHSTISSSFTPFSSCPQSFPASGSFSMSQFFTSGGKSIGISASTSVLLMNIQDWFLLGWTGWIYLQSQGLSRVLQHHSSKASILQCSAFFIVQLSHPYMTNGKTIALTRWTFVGKVISLLLCCLDWSWLFFPGGSVF